MIYIHRRSPDINCCLALLARFSRFLSFLSVRVGKKKKKSSPGKFGCSITPRDKLAKDLIAENVAMGH